MLLLWCLMLPLCSGNFDVPINETWMRGFKTDMCVPITTELHSWKLHLISDVPISSLNSGGATIQKVGDGKEHVLTNRQWNADEHVGDILCLNLVGATKSTRIPTLTAFIEGMESTNGPKFTVINPSITKATTTATTSAPTSAITTTSTATVSTVTVSETTTVTPTAPTAAASVNIATDDFTGITEDTTYDTTAPSAGRPILQGSNSPVTTTVNPFALLCKEYGVYCTSTSAKQSPPA